MIAPRPIALLAAALLAAGCDSEQAPGSRAPANPADALPGSEITRVDLHPVSRDERLARAERYFGEQRYAEASAEYRRVLLAEPENAAALMGLGRVALSMRDFESALRISGRVVEVKSDDAFAHNLHAVSLVSAGRKREAAKAFRRALELRPDDPQILVNAAICHADLGEWGRADALAVRAGEVIPASSAPHALRGNFLVRQGKPAEAVPHLRLALARAPDQGTAHYRLGVALLKAGQKGEGKRSLQAALETDPPEPVRKEIRALLAEK